MNRFFTLACGQRPDEEFYDLRSDPGQLQNVAKHPEFAAQRDELSQRLIIELHETPSSE